MSTTRMYLFAIAIAFATMAGVNAAIAEGIMQGTWEHAIVDGMIALVLVFGLDLKRPRPS